MGYGDPEPYPCYIAPIKKVFIARRSGRKVKDVMKTFSAGLDQFRK